MIIGATRYNFHLTTHFLYKVAKELYRLPLLSFFYCKINLFWCFMSRRGRNLDLLMYFCKIKIYIIIIWYSIIYG